MPTATGGSPHVVIIGAGVIGACTAAYLQQQGARITLIDRQVPGDDGADVVRQRRLALAFVRGPDPGAGHVVEGPGLVVEGGRTASPSAGPTCRSSCPGSSGSFAPAAMPSISAAPRRPLPRCTHPRSNSTPSSLGTLECRSWWHRSSTCTSTAPKRDTRAPSASGRCAASTARTSRCSGAASSARRSPTSRPTTSRACASRDRAAP